MEASLRKTGGIYPVHSESRNTYRVDIALGECTCPDQQRTSPEHSKHLRRVGSEIRQRMVPTPDSRLPERLIADIGLDAEGTAEDVPDGRRVEGPIYDRNRLDRFSRTAEELIDVLEY